MAALNPDPRDAHLSEVDLALVHALQVDARAPWSRIAHAIGVDAATVARRWAAIAESRAAWFTVWPTPERHSAESDMAIVLVSGPLTSDDESEWCALPWVLTVERTSRGLMLFTVGHGGLGPLDARIRETFARPGLTLEVEYAAAVLREDSTWRLRVLSAQQVAQIAPAAPELHERSRAVKDATVEEITALLREDARMSLGTVATRLGVSDATARRTVERLVGQRMLKVGCDVAMPRVGMGRGVVLRINGWHAADPVVREAVLQHPAVHRVVATVGSAEVTVCVRFGALVNLPAIEREWLGLEVIDRWTVTSSLKRNGHVLGLDGSSIGHVDVDW